MDFEFFQDKLNSFFTNDGFTDETGPPTQRKVSKVLSWHVDQEFRLTEFNQAFSQRFEESLGIVPEIGSSVLSLISDSKLTTQFQDWLDWYQRGIAGENFAIITTWPAQGNDILEEVFFQTTYDNVGKTDGVSCFSREISREEIQLEDQLQEIEKRYRTLTLHSRDILAMHELDGTYEYINPVSEDIWGHKIEHCLGRKPIDFIHPADLQEFKRIFFLPLYIGNKYTPFAKAFRFKNARGEYIWLEMLVTVLTNDEDKPIKLISSTRSLRNCVRDPEKTLVHNDDLALLINSNDIMLASVDLMGNFNYFSDDFRKYYLEKEGLELREGQRLKESHPFMHVWDQIEPVLFGNPSSINLEIPGVSSDESQFFIVRPIIDQYGDTTGISLLGV